MIRKSYTAILEKVKEIDSFLTSYGISCNKNDRIHKAISLIDGLNKVLGDNEKMHQYLASFDKKGECLFSLVELSELAHILDNLGQQDSNTLKDKIKKIIDGPLLSIAESATSNIARNTMFELSLTADLMSRGIKATLGNPNPDISVIFPNRSYLIQCKRTFSENNIEKLISDAKNQLVADLDNGANSYGVIALSLSRIYVQGKNLLVSRSEDSARAFLYKTLEKFMIANQRYWKKITNNRIVAIILHISCPAVIEEEKLLTWAHVMIGNNISDDGTFDLFFSDFNKLITD